MFVYESDVICFYHFVHMQDNAYFFFWLKTDWDRRSFYSSGVFGKYAEDSFYVRYFLKPKVGKFSNQIKKSTVLYDIVI